MHDLYARYCAPVTETVQFRDIAQRTLGTLHLVSALLGDMQGAAEGYGARLRSASEDLDAQADPLRPLVARLAADTHDMITHSELLMGRLTASAQRIDELELFLSEARREASTDPLTGLANRRAFDIALRQAAGEAMNSALPLGVLIADVDRFKAVNDRWGHDIGDEVLRQVSASMIETVRGRDMVARLGGGGVRRRAAGYRACRRRRRGRARAGGRGRVPRYSGGQQHNGASHDFHRGDLLRRRRKTERPGGPRGRRALPRQAGGAESDCAGWGRKLKRKARALPWTRWGR
ncbi:MAG: GGDEF domain-containing protein [Rhodospirillales bacterium]